MKKVYEPLPMIMNGRYAVLYGKLSAFSLGPKRQRLLHAAPLTARQSAKAACPAILMKNETGSPHK